MKSEAFANVSGDLVVAVDNVERYVRGEPLKNRVSAEKYELMT